MSQGRRYTDKEIAEIFKRATEDLEAFRQERTGGEGLSLEELQEIGKESGIPPEFIARAASSMENAGRITSEEVMGIKVGTGRILDLPRRLTEEEWEALVVDLRTTFNARGKIRQEGAFRQWTNGNLQFLLEPQGEGSRLVMKTVKGSAQQSISSGITFMTTGFVIGCAALVAGKLDTMLSGITMFILLVSLGMILGPRFTVPQWAERRKEQMRAISARLLERMDDTHLKVEKLEASISTPTSKIEMDAALPEENEESKAPAGRGRTRS